MLPFSCVALFCYTFLSVCYMWLSLLWVFSGCGPYFKLIIKNLNNDLYDRYKTVVFWYGFQPYRPALFLMTSLLWWHFGAGVHVCGSSPGGVYASMEVCTTSERLLEGIGTAIFLSTCRASTACTASVCTSGRERATEGGRVRFWDFSWKYQ